VINAADMQQMMLDFAKTAHETLLFLKHIRKVSFYQLDANNNIHLLQSHEASFENKSEKEKLKKFWDGFINMTKTDFKFRQIISMKSSVNLTISSFAKDASVTRHYHVRQQYGFENLELSNNKEEIDSLEQNKVGKFYPLAGIAYERSLDRKLAYKLYNFLPLHQDSPIACHVNGYFGLHNENRTQLFARATTGLINQSEAKWFTDWNKALIARIVLPLYVETLRDRLSDERDRPDTLLQHFYSVFPTNKSSELQDYFKFLTEDFYRKALEVECIPVYYPGDTDVKIVRPSQLLFAKNITKFLTDKGCKVAEISEICDIVSGVVTNYCKHDRVATMFKLYGKTDLKQLDTESFLNGLKKYDRHEGLQLSYSDFKSIKNATMLLRFCLEGQQDFSFLEKVPLLITSDSVIRLFSSVKPVFHLPAEHINFFSEKSGLQFLHPELLEIPQLAASLPFFKEFDISDLNTICQKIFDKRQQPGVAGGYPEAQDALRTPLKLIWKFIIQHQGKVGDISRSQQIEQLSAIKDWPLIPVALSTGAVGLAPLSHIEKIRNEAPASSDLKQLLNQFPATKSNFFNDQFQISFRQFIDRLVMDPCNRPSDLVILLSAKNSDKICKKLDNSFNRPYDTVTEKYYLSLLKTNEEKLNLRTDNQLKAMIKGLPIFHSYASAELIRLSNKSAYAIKSSPGGTFKENLFEKYLASKSLVLVKSSHVNLNSYLEIEDRSLTQLYKEFFAWSLGQPQNPSLCKQIMTLLKDHFASDQQGLLID